MKIAKMMFAAFLVCLLAVLGTAQEKPMPTREAAVKLMKDGNFAEAYEALSRRALDTATDPTEAANDLADGVNCLNRLGREKEFDKFVEDVVAANKEDWAILAKAAELYLNGQHDGFVIAGQFERGSHRGGQGKYVNSYERDRVRALQLLLEAIRHCKTGTAYAPAELHWQLARALLGERGFQGAWRLQELTDLTQLPDYEEGYRGYMYGGGERGASVDADGNPIYYSVPESWEKAQSDGERWRFALDQTEKLDPRRRQETQFQFANFLKSQFGVHTLAGRPWLMRALADDESLEAAAAPYRLHTLEENETLARLAVGVRRFDLPDEFNYIRIFRELADGKGNYAEQSLNTLAEIFENRRQFEKAAEMWRRSLAMSRNDWKQGRLDQIVGNWGTFEPVVTQPAGENATVEFRFRNGNRIHFDAYEVNVPLLLKGVKEYLRSSPRQLDWNQVNVQDVGRRIVFEDQRKYVGERVANWDMDLEPLPHHFDKRITVRTPLRKAGAYLLEGRMENGNTSRILIWVADTAIVRKPVVDSMYCFIADAVTGAPVPAATVEFFGYRQEWVENRITGRGNQNILTTEFTETADADGQVFAKQPDERYQWLITATTPEGRLAYLGFTSAWRPRYYDQEYNQQKTFVITDRPVYRPGQTVKFKVWISQAQYDREGASPFAGRGVTVEVRDPRSEKVFDKHLVADEYGGVEGEFDLGPEATLGVYGVSLPGLGGGNFRVEEYRKPEFEVTVAAPEKPVMLGDKIEAKVTAKYYFGAPVAQGKAKIKVMRTAYTERWYPPAPWDWLYGRGYGWLMMDCAWYPGWGRWGHPRPFMEWWPMPQQPPELVAEMELPLDENGQVTVPIDTSLAKAVLGDMDHRYEITAEVTDQSRRTIVGSGSVIAARHPFRVTAWTTRGHYRAGDVIEAEFAARTPDQKPVKGSGSAKLFRIEYDAKGNPTETMAQEWRVETDSDGMGRLQMKAAQAGQYRLSVELTDEAKHTIEGACLLTVMGEGVAAKDFRFNDIELTPDRREYAAGDKMSLMISAARDDATVLLFLRPVNGAYQRPKVLRVRGKETMEIVEIAKRDMPNFFVEAVTVSGGKVYSDMREIAVPPESRILNVEAMADKKEYLPGQEADVTLKVTDAEGNPFTGSFAISIYDKSVEYISGGSNVPDIRKFFWEWKRHHSPSTESSLDRGSGDLLKKNEKGMGYIGVFGHIVQEGRIFDERIGVSYGFNARVGVAKGMAMDGVAASAGAPMMAEAEGIGALGEMPQPATVEPTVRTAFADTALWVATLNTEKDGTAKVSLKMPENLTTWKARVWAMGYGTRVGEATTEIITTKNLIVRLQAPRFFVQKDEVVLSANVHNYLETKKEVRVVLELAGGCLELMEGEEANRTVTVEPNGETRVDWRVRATAEGEAIIRMKALTDEESDAVEEKRPVLVHGMLKTESWSGALRPEEIVAMLTVRVPEERRPEQTRLEVRYSPSLAMAMVDALPYLADYPYGCTEQTLNRFIPAAITRNTLLRMGLDLDDIGKKRANLNAQEIGDDVERAKRWKRFDRNPVFDEAELDAMVKAGIQRLSDMQCSDGGWGWFSGWGERSYPHTTALVVHGLQVAKASGEALPENMLERGVGWLAVYQKRELEKLRNYPNKINPWKEHADNLDAFVYMVLADAEQDEPAMREFIYRDRTHLSVYAKAMFGLALHKVGDIEKRDMLLRNMEQYVVRDDENQTAYLRMPEGNWWWCWYGSETEAMAFYLKLLAATDPKGETAARLAKYMVNNRKHATYWNSTRDTALCIESLADFILASGEEKPDMTVTVLVDGKERKRVTITAADMFTYDNKLVIEGPELGTGEHRIEIRREGKGPLYFNAYLTNFTLEDPITKAGLEIKVERAAYKLVPVEKTVSAQGQRGQVLKQRVEKYERVPISDLATLKSGDLVEVEMVVESKNDYEYIIIEDWKAAGFEPVEVRSGYTGNELGAYVEFRDERTAFFVRMLARGRHSVSYRLRAETPGRFSALPAVGEGMYAPELKANSDEAKVSIED
jgi:hypothetical protein